MNGLHKSAPPPQHVTSRSGLLVRLGRRCSQACVMCPNEPSPSSVDLPADEALQRVDHAAKVGFRRVILSGGEPTEHAAFRAVARRLHEHGLAWDLLTTGRTLADRNLAAELVACGLDRVVISLHGHEPEAHARICRVPPTAWGETVSGVRAALAAGVSVTLNHVVQRPNLAHCEKFVDGVATDLGRRVTIKLAFPLFDLHGRDQPDVALRYTEAGPPVDHALARARELGLAVVVEGFPPCALASSDARRMGRAGFGVTHVLDDTDGRTIVAVADVDAARGVYAEACRPCSRRADCPGVDERYAARFGLAELPLTGQPWLAHSS